MTIIAGTGHRPDRTVWGYAEKHPLLNNLRFTIKHELSRREPSAVISGMALGFDTYLAEAALELEIPLWCYLPFEGQESRWSLESQERYMQFLERAEKIQYVSNKPNKGAYLVRNKQMVDDADRLFAFWNPDIKTSGTAYTVRYAGTKQGMWIDNFWRDEYGA